MRKCQKKNWGVDENDGEIKIVNNSNHDSNSYLEYSSFEYYNRYNDNIELKYFIGKDNTTKWFNTPIISKLIK